MATIDSIAQQRAYSRELVAILAGATVAGMASAALMAISQGRGVAELGALSFCALLGLGANLLDTRTSRGIVRLLMGLGAGAVMAMLITAWPLLAGLVAGVALGASFSLEHGTSPLKRAVLWLGYGLALMAGVYTSQTLIDHGFLYSFSQEMPAVAEVARAGIWGLFLMVPAGLKFVSWESDEVLAEYRAAEKEATSDSVRSLLVAARQTYERIADEIAREEQEAMRDRAESIAAEVSRGLISLMKRSGELSATLRGTQGRALEARAQELEDRIRHTRDASLRRELAAALREIVEQMRARKRLETACARLEARQQRYLTALDRLHVALVQGDTLSDVASGALSHSLDELSQLTREVQWKNLSVEELCDSDLERELSSIEGVESPQEDEELSELFSELRDLSAAPAREERVVLGGGADGFVTHASCESQTIEEDAQAEASHHAQHRTR